MDRTTIFTWGYYGWGNHTAQLIEAVDAVEMGRGFKPPLFVDIRIRRTVRAVGFIGSAFEKQIGSKRYRWLKSLGNKYIESRTGPSIQIADPSAANELLDLALDCANNKQRLLFFCSCQWPRCEGKIVCHRTTVAELVRNAAQKRGVQVEIVEWPGANPSKIDLEVSSKNFTAIHKGRVTIPVGKQTNLAEIGGLPWCSIANLHSNGKMLHRIVGPAIFQKDDWALPVLRFVADANTSLNGYVREAARMRVDFGLNSAES